MWGPGEGKVFSMSNEQQRAPCYCGGHAQRGAVANRPVGLGVKTWGDCVRLGHCKSVDFRCKVR